MRQVFADLRKFSGWHTATWLVELLTLQTYRRIFQRVCHGVVYDIGCGIKPYRGLIEPLTQRYIGVDHAGCPHGTAHIDVTGTAYATTLPSGSADMVFASAVLEHLEQPQRALDEMFRLCKPGGCVVLGAPLFWCVHEAPRDFFRYTAHGLGHLLNTAGFTVEEITPLSGFWVMAAAQLAVFLGSHNKGWIRVVPVLPLAAVLVQALGLLLQTVDRGGREWTWAYVAVGRKE